MSDHFQSPPPGEGDPIGDLLWGVVVIFGFAVICLIVLGGKLA